MGPSGRTMASRTRSYRSTGTGYDPQEGMTGSSTGIDVHDDHLWGVGAGLG